MKIKNETEIQLMKILFKTSGKKPTKNMTSRRAYPHGLEMQYYRKLKGFFKPLTDYVSEYLDKNIESLLRGDSESVRLDTVAGESFRSMIYNLENWLSLYMPDISDLPADSNNNVILTSLARTAEEAKEFGDKEFQKTIEKGIHVNPPVSSSWWNDMRNSWAEDNYTLITSNAKNYVSKINTLTEQAIVNGLSPMKLKEEIKKATEGLSDKHCKLLARDQMGKLNGQITEAQMQEVGLDLYVWSTAYDDRVRDSHAVMEGLLCRWDDASVCSYDNGKTWVARPSGAVDLHPGQDIQCRCVGLAFYPELEAEVQGIPMSEITSELPPVQDLPQFMETLSKMPQYLRDNIEELRKEFDYSEPVESTQERLKNIMDNTSVNPHYMDSALMKKRYKRYQYTENCQRCVPALQMQMKGFETTALPLPKKRPDYSDLCYGNNWLKWMKNRDGSAVKSINVVSDLMNNTEVDSNNVLLAIFKYMNEQPEGSMFELRCSWKSKGGHVFAGFKVNGTTVLYDPQTNKYDTSIYDYFEKMKLEKLEIVRTDDKIIDVNIIKQCVKNIKK